MGTNGASAEKLFRHIRWLNNIEVNSGSKLIVILFMLVNKINLVKMVMSIKIGNMNVDK